jgi:hypothetical protein
LRGSLPLYRNHLEIIADVRGRFLKQGGVLVPERDRLMAAVVEEPNLYALAVCPGCGPLGVTLESVRARLLNTTYVIPASGVLPPESMISDAVAWAVLEYATVSPVPVGGVAELHVNRPSTAHGLMVWFETVLAREHGFSTATGQLNCYGRLFLPWPRPVALAKGDVVTVELWAQPDGDPWGWNSSVRAGHGTQELFKQSSFLSVQSKPTGRVRSGGVATWSQITRS